MVSPISTILYKATKEDSHLNILAPLFSERYISYLANIPNTTFFVLVPENEFWDFIQVDIPENMCELRSILPNAINYDLVLCANNQNRAGYDTARNLSNALHLPLLCLEWLENALDNPIKPAHTTVFTGGFQQPVKNILTKQRSIHHCVCTKTFRPSSPKEEPYGLLVGNNLDINEKFLFSQLTTKYPLKVLGKNVKLGKHVDTPTLVREYSQASFLVNFNTNSVCPLPVLEAAACECPVVSLKSKGIEEYVSHEKTGFLGNNIKEINEFLNNTSLNTLQEFGKNARKKVEEEFMMENFLKHWQEVLETTANITYIGNPE